MTDSLYQRKQEGRLIDPALRARIAAYIDKFYEPVIELRSMSVESAGFGGADFDGFYERDAAVPARAAGAPPSGLAEWLEQRDESFADSVLAIIDRKGLTDAEVYNKVGISRQVFSNLRTKPGYTPSIETALALCIALELSVEEANELLARAGMTLSTSNKRDLIVEFFLDNGVYDIMAINEALYEFDQPLL